MRRVLLLTLCSLYLLALNTAFAAPRAKNHKKDVVLGTPIPAEPESVTSVKEHMEAGAWAYQSGAYDVAFQEFKMMSDRGYPEAQNYLAYMYAKGEGTLKDVKEAFILFTEAAHKGIPSAQNNLAYMYYHGIGVEKNEEKAFEWYKKAAEKGIVQAQTSLAIIYENTTLDIQSINMAMLWYFKAAKQRDTVAQYSLGHIYYQGIGGIPRNFIEAYKWLYLAGASRKPERIELVSAVTKMREAVVLEISAEGLARAKKRAAAWARKYPRPSNPAPKAQWKNLGTALTFEIVPPFLQEKSAAE